MAHLLDLPNELLLRIAQYQSNKDLKALVRTCRTLHTVLGPEMRLHNVVSLRHGLDTRRRLYEMARHPHRFGRIQDLTILLKIDSLGDGHGHKWPWQPSSAELTSLLQDWKRLQDHANWLALVWSHYPRLGWHVEFMLYILNCHNLQSLTLRALDYEREEDSTREPWRCDISSCARILSSSLWQTGVLRRLSCLTLDAMRVYANDVDLPFEGMQITDLRLFDCAIDSRSWVDFFQYFPSLRYLFIKWTTRCRDSEEECYRDDYEDYEDYQGLEPGEDNPRLTELYEGLYQCRTTIECIDIDVNESGYSLFKQDVLGHFQDFAKLRVSRILIGDERNWKEHVWLALDHMPGYIEHYVQHVRKYKVKPYKTLFERVYRASSTEEEVDWWDKSDSDSDTE